MTEPVLQNWKLHYEVGFEVFIAVKIEVLVFWVVAIMTSIL